MEYAIPVLAFAVFCGCHYGLTRWTRRGMDPENRGYDIPFPLWLHFIVAIPSLLCTAAILYVILKAMS